MAPVVALGCAIACLAAPAAAQVTSRVSLDSGGSQGNGHCDGPSISADGRFVAFYSHADDLVGGDTNGVPDVFLRDRTSGATERVSVDSAGIQGNSACFDSSISADGRFVAFSGTASNLVGGDTNGHSDVFLRDRASGTTVRLSVDSSGSQADGDSYGPRISPDGRYVVFYSTASNLASGDTNGFADVFLRDRTLGTTERVSVGSGGAEGNDDSYAGRVTADGRYVAFQSFASTLVSGDTNQRADIFLRDRQTGTTERVSVDSSGAEGNRDCWAPSISADGRYVAFESAAFDLVGGDTNGFDDVFVRDRQNGTTERVSVDSTGAQGDGPSYVPSISANGRFVAFQSSAGNLVGADTNGGGDVFVHDRRNGVTERASVGTAGAQGNGESRHPSISADGGTLAFSSHAIDLVSGDTNGVLDIFVRDRSYEPFESLCDAGTSGVVACPCSNPPGGAGRGCDNSAGTGGAILSGAGVAYLSADTLVFTTQGERATAVSIVLQGDALVPAGAVFGQGVRCVGGTTATLYVKTASSGSITAPDPGAGDPPVSARSASLGDSIPAGQSRWYLVYYRDGVVPGGCPAASTFNATQTGVVVWLP